ncbi:MAG: hypothetical protein ACK2UK_16520 [Candidatus Promineifilaceae bacterium]
MFGRRSWVFVLLLVLLTAVACQGAANAPAEQAASGETVAAAATAVVEQVADAADTAADAAMLPEVTFAAKDNAYQGPESISGGWTKVIFDNQDAAPHELVLVQLLEGKTMDDVLPILDSEDGPPSWAAIRGSLSAAGGESTSFIGDLEPGSYVMLSTAGGEEGPPDFAQGLLRELTVTEATAEVPDSALPQPDATIKLVDYQFVVDGLKSGSQLVRYSNEGTETHEAVMFRLAEGKTMDDFMAFMEADGEDAPPPFDGEPTFTMLAPGSVVYNTLELESGNYVLICFLPSESHDNTPHAMLGMISEVTIE